MKVGVIGSRNFNDYNLLKSVLDDLDISVIISGGAKGADSLAELWASDNNVKTEIYKPNWSLGRRAAAIRNIEIVKNSELIVAFWDGKSSGTKMTLDIAKSKNKKIIKIISNAKF